MNNTKWIYRSDYTPKKNSLSLDKDIINILYNRGITEEDDIEKFLHCSLDDITDPFQMTDVKKSVDRILAAREIGETIWIYGDYDVDGTTSVAMMYLFLKKHNTNIEYYIPCRYNEGYGISLTGIDYAKANNFSLIISLDCGIRAINQIDYANENNIDFIICDHHTPSNE
ncbi:MAG: DHH family phosphoesterase, partial [Mycoplasmataceae bacterium]|nr:DHH family phosphoesterase [Mycoplasmataceae bacterium]